ncbi:unnamed protein product [Pleuronectes platessa]|uniref:Uncharacterized protein n=1 Tax=Pleuronectes platessa TaxID=8262 RepID=A0A9N7VWQ7_PLEPL|nr:unnamed protein product [Pleuronectes platessa]
MACFFKLFLSDYKFSLRLTLGVGRRSLETKHLSYFSEHERRKCQVALMLQSAFFHSRLSLHSSAAGDLAGNYPVHQPFPPHSQAHATETCRCCRPERRRLSILLRDYRAR